MTTEKAIEMCEAIKDYLTGGNPVWSKEEVAEAMTMAIEALDNERPKGHWIMKWRGNGWNEAWDYTCSACGKEFKDADSVLYNSSYCPNCGAEIMVGGDEWRIDDD